MQPRKMKYHNYTELHFTASSVLFGELKFLLQYLFTQILLQSISEQKLSNVPKPHCTRKKPHDFCRKYYVITQTSKEEARVLVVWFGFGGGCFFFPIENKS